MRTEPRWSELETIAAVRMATSDDRVDGVLPARVVAPESTEQVSAVLAWANERDVRIVARGGGSKLGWRNPARSVDLILSLEKFQRVVEHAWQDMTVTVETGTTIASLQSELAKQRQRLPLDALWPERSTVGGMIAANDSGALRLRYGSIRDLILGVTVVLANGTIARSGGRVVKNVAGYDLPKLFAGSFGTLGIITEVTLRTYPLPHSVRTISIPFTDLADANRYMLAIADTSLVPTGMQLRVSSGQSPMVDVRFEGLEEGITAQVQKATMLASSGKVIAASEDVWSKREELWNADESAMVGKFSVLPSKIAECINVIASHCDPFAAISQSLGLGLCRIKIKDPHALVALRTAIHQLGGTLTLLHAPLEIRRGVDSFGDTGSAHPLMIRIKQRFDPRGILSPGRFVGGI